MRRLALTLALSPAPGCTVMLEVGVIPGTSGDDASTGDLDSTGRAPASTSTGGSSGADSTGDADDSSSSLATGSDDSGAAESTGPALAPLGAPCGDDSECDSGACSPLAVCAPPCPCEVDATCLPGGACIVIGLDPEAGIIAINESPAGTVDADDVDVYGLQLQAPGAYAVKIHGAGVTAYIVDSDGSILATPDDAVSIDREGLMTERDFKVDAVSDDPVVVIIVAPAVDASTDYYFYTHTL